MHTARGRHPVGLAAQLMSHTGINALRFAGAEELLEHGAALIDETGRGRLRGGRLVLTVQATRATHTFEAVIALCRIGRGVQASMLNRASFEDVLDAHWVAANPEQAPELADDHDRLIGLAERDTLARFGRPVTPLSSEEQEKLHRLLRLYDGLRASWTRTSQEERRTLVKERWGEEVVSELDFVYELIQRQNNTLLHGSPTAYRHALAVDESGRPKQLNRIGPDRRWRDALAHGVLAYYMICRVLAEEFSLDKKPAAEAFNRVSCYLKEISVGDLAALVPSADCPCGSGQSVRECHRA